MLIYFLFARAFNPFVVFCNSDILCLFQLVCGASDVAAAGVWVGQGRGRFQWHAGGLRGAGSLWLGSCAPLGHPAIYVADLELGVVLQRYRHHVRWPRWTRHRDPTRPPAADGYARASGGHGDRLHVDFMHVASEMHVTLRLLFKIDPCVSFVIARCHRDHVLLNGVCVVGFGCWLGWAGLGWAAGLS
jgi:hypothetical protein